MSTYVLYGELVDAYIESSAVDYETARAGASLVVGSVTDDISAYQNLSGGTYIITEGCVEFHLLSPLGGPVYSAELSAYCKAKQGTEVIEVRAHDWQDSGPATEDWVPGADLGTPSLVASIATADLTVSALNAFEDVDLATHINTAGGPTRFLLNAEGHRLGTVPGGQVGATFASADTAGTTQDPVLTILDAPPGPTFMGKNGGSNGSGATTLGVTISPAPTFGNSLILAITVRGTTTTCSHADWMDISGGGYSDGANSRTYVFRRPVKATEGTDTFTLGASVKASYFPIEVIGADPDAPIDAIAAQANASSTSCPCPSIDPTQEGDLLVYIGGTAIGTTCQSGAALGASSTGGSAASRTTTTVGAIEGASGDPTGTYTITFADAATNVGVSIAIKGPPVGEPLPPDPSPVLFS
jgi:hypothetical protein